MSFSPQDGHLACCSADLSARAKRSSGDVTIVSLKTGSHTYVVHSRHAVLQLHTVNGEALAVTAARKIPIAAAKAIAHRVGP